MTKIDNETAKKVMDILSNPEMMSRISAIASGSSQKAVPPSPEPPAVPTSPTPSKADLLMAIKPFLKAEKRGKIDSVIKALTVATVVSKMKGGDMGNV